MKTELPLHCPKFGSDHLRSPCAGQLSRIKAKRKEFPEAWLGPLEHCLGCEGKDLVVRERQEP